MNTGRKDRPMGESYSVLAEGTAGSASWHGLTEAEAAARCEAERGKSKWGKVTVRDGHGRAVASYLGGMRLAMAGREAKS